MVCFCDIPLSQIKDHIENYGHYAIGLSKDWGKRNGINPVLYSYPESTYSIAVYNMGTNIFEEIQKQNINKSVLEFANYILIYTTLFTKPYEGELIREGISPKTVRFYDEREWRYIPQLPKIIELGLPLVLEEKTFEEDKGLVQDNERKLASKSRLSFQPGDIKYLIVDKENEILQLMNRIDQIKRPKYSENDIRMLYTRIMSIEHILDDL
jgi:hypothetical protein